MAKLPKYTVSKDEDGKWAPSADRGQQAKKPFDTKADITAGGALKKALGNPGGSVNLQKVD